MTAILGQAKLGSLVLGQGASVAPDVNPGVRSRASRPRGFAPPSGGLRRTVNFHTGESPLPQTIFNRGWRDCPPPVPLPVKHGVTKRFGPQIPPDQTPIMPPARRCELGDLLPPQGLEGRTRFAPPAPDFVAQPPGIIARMVSRLLPSPPPDHSRIKRSRPILNDIGDDLPIIPSRQSIGQGQTFPSRIKRSLVPQPDPEPEVLPPRRLLCQTPHLDVVLLWMPFKERRLLLSAAASPFIPAACPYRPSVPDEPQTGMASRVDEQDSQGQDRPDDADYFPTRVDECS